MATGITIEIGLNKAKAEKDFKSLADTGEKEVRRVSSALDAGSGSARRFESAIDSNAAHMAALRREVSALHTDMRNLARQASQSAQSLKSAFSSISGLLPGIGALGFGSAAIKKAFDADALRTQLTSMLGSVEAANKKILEFREIARTTPGVLASGLTEAFTQLRQISGLTEATTTKFATAVNQIKALFPAVGDVGGLALNLQQIYSQNFELEDVKQLRGTAPGLFEAVQKRLGASGLEDLRKFKDAGRLSAEAYAGAFIDEIVSRSGSITETLQLRIAKSLEDTNIKLAEIGDKILKDIIPAFQKLLPSVNSVLDVFNKLPGSAQAATIGIIAIAPAISPVVTAVRTLSTAFLGLGAAMQASLGIAGLLSVGVGVAYFGFQEMLDRQRRDIDRRLGPRKNIDGSPVNPLDFSTLTPSGDPLKIGTGKLGALDPTTGVFSAAATNAANLKNLGATGAALKTNEETAKIAKQVAEAQKSILEAQKDRGQRLLDEMTALEAEVTANRRELENAPAAREARRAQVAGFSAANAERLSRLDFESRSLEQNTAKAALEKQAEILKAIPPAISESARLMDGFKSATISAGDAFDRLGNNVAQSLLSVRGALEGLRQSVKNFFNDLIGGLLQNLVGGVLGQLTGKGGSFRTSGPQSVSSSALQNLVGAASIGVAPSVTATSQLQSFFGGGGGSAAGGDVVRQVTQGAGSGFSLSGILGGLTSAAPLLGAGIGAGFGGQSTFGNILGAVGGGAVGLGVSFGASVFGAGGGLGQAALAALGPIALIGAPLLVGAIFAGKAAQRKKDEEAAGQYLTQALQALDQLISGVQSGSIDGNQARSIFENQILGTFIQQINGLKTESVRKSRLTNQVADLRKVYEARVTPAIAEQQKRAAESALNASNFSRQIPEFASGGYVGGIDRGFDSVKALLRPGELVLNRAQQSAVMSRAGSDVFRNIGVPTVNTTGRYADGGYVPSGGKGGDQSINIYLDATVDSEGIFIRGGSTKNGQRVIINQINQARLNREF